MIIFDVLFLISFLVLIRNEAINKPIKPIKPYVSLSPTKEEFVSKIKGVIAGFEHTVGKSKQQ